MKINLIGIFVLCFCLRGVAEIPSSLDWQLKHEEPNLKIYTAQIHHSKLKAVRIETSFKSSVAPLVELLFEPEKRQSWDEMCRYVEVLNRSERRNTSYLQFDMPWPVRDRDIVINSHIEAVGNIVTITSEAGGFSVPQNTKFKRVTEAWYRWQLIDRNEPDQAELLPNDVIAAELKTDLIAEMFMDPVGPIPAWLLNHLALTQPRITIEKLRQKVE